MRRGITALVPLPKEPEHQLPACRPPNHTVLVTKLSILVGLSLFVSFVLKIHNTHNGQKPPLVKATWISPLNINMPSLEQLHIVTF